MYIYIYIFIYIPLCVCVCVFVLVFLFFFVFPLTAERYRVLVDSKKGTHRHTQPVRGRGGRPAITFGRSNKPHTDGAGKNRSRL